MQWTDYRAAADKAAQWAAGLDRQGRAEDALMMRLLAEAAAEKAESLAVAAVAGAPAQRDSRDGPACSLCGRPGVTDGDGDGSTVTCYNPECVRFRVLVAADRF